MQGSNGQKNPHKVVMARVQTAIKDPKSRHSFKTVEGYDTLPPKVKDALEALKPQELDVLSNTVEKLSDAGLYEDNEGGRLGFF